MKGSETMTQQDKVKLTKTTKDRLFTTFAYYGGAIDFKELTSNRQRIIGIAYSGGEIETNYIFPNHSYLNKYYDGKYLVENEDTFFALSTNPSYNNNTGKYVVLTLFLLWPLNSNFVSNKALFSIFITFGILIAPSFSS